MTTNKDTRNWPIVAICYDFDKTLSPCDMQEYTVFPKLKIEPKDFWAEAGKLAKDNKMCKMLSYMRLILHKAQTQENALSFLKNDFAEMGSSVELFDGVESWFERINNYAEEMQINVEHYIISAGLKEIIEGTSIAKYFKEIYASSYLYVDDIPKWPCQVVNYTQKTQYLFRISKNCLDLSDEISINESISEDCRRVPLRNFIYIGDSETDIPAMRVVSSNGGKAISVYNPQTANAETSCELISQKRINFFAPADYRDDSELDKYVKAALRQIKTSEELVSINKKQSELTEFLSRLDNFCSHMKNAVNECKAILDLEHLSESISRVLKSAVNFVRKTYNGDMFNAKDIIQVVESKKLNMQQLLESRKEVLKKKIEAK